MRTTLLMTALPGLVLLAAPRATAATVTVHIVNFDFTSTGTGGPHFDPTINVGDTVQWVWDQSHHSTQSVTGLTESWDSGVQNTPFTFNHTFTHPGDFAYYCILHGSDNGNGTASGMSGIVHVQSSPTNAYVQTNLVSDIAGRAARQDTNLVNAWGLARTSTGPWWVNSAGKGLSLLYNGSGGTVPLVVTVPPAPGNPAPSSPTGIVYNPTTSFQIAPGRAGIFLFATEDGTISGWNAAVDPANAVIKVNRSGSAVYDGLAMGQISGANVLYAANFFGSAIEVFDASFNLMTLGANAFKDTAVPAGYGPFNVQNINGAIYVTWAKQDATKADEVPGAGFGYVSAFNQDGTFLRRLTHGNWMNAPWGVALAPANFGALSNMLLVGQFGNGTIIAFNATTGVITNAMKRPNGQPVIIPGLWGLAFGNGGQAGAVNSLYFAAGIGAEAHGLFGSLTAQ